MSNEIQLFINEFTHIKLLRSVEQYHCSIIPGKNHESKCLVCQKKLIPLVRNLLDTYFNIQQQHYWSLFNNLDQRTINNFPVPEKWLDQECYLCKNKMNRNENCVGLYDCKHIFHEYCLYKYINIEPNQICPIENCNCKIMLPIDFISLHPFNITS